MGSVLCGGACADEEGSMAVTRTVEAEGHAEALVDRLRADWLRGPDWGRS